MAATPTLPAALLSDLAGGYCYLEPKTRRILTPRELAESWAAGEPLHVYHLPILPARDYDLIDAGSGEILLEDVLGCEVASTMRRIGLALVEVGNRHVKVRLLAG